MKRLVIAALAIGAMASCTKSNVQYEQPGEISLQPVTQKATKAAIDGNKYPDDGRFKVWALWTKAAESSASDIPSSLDPAEYVIYINGGEFAKKEDLNSWGGVPPCYWPTTGSLFFAGYSPADASGTFNYSWQTKTFTATGYEQDTHINNTKDLMWFDVTDQSYNNNKNSITEGETTKSVKGVPVKFKHALSWLTFKFYLKEDTTPEYWTIKSVVLKGIETTANFKVINKIPNWETPTNEATEGITVYSNTTGHLVKKTYDTAAAAILENAPNGVLIIPQSCAPSNGTNPAEAELVITYDLKSPTGQTLTNQNVSLPLNGANINENKWELGKHYIYTITFGGNEILIYPEVTTWTDVNQNIEVQ